MATTIAPRDHGPYILEGDFVVMSPSGGEIPHQGTHAAFCRLQ